MAINPINIRQLPPIYDGLTIVVQGAIHPHANRLAINLCAGPNFGQNDTALHVNPRYDQQNVVVRNSFINGAWGAEERGGAAFNVQKGQQLECIMLIQPDVIKVAFNGQHYFEYRHRIQMERITHVVVSDGLHVQNITFYGPSTPPMGAYVGMPAGGYGYPGAAPAIHGSYPAPAMPYNSQAGGYPALPAGYPSYPTGQSVPASTPGKQFIPGGLVLGRLINVTLVPGSVQFAINLKYQADGGDIAFHFNPRIQKKVVVRNSLIGGSWGGEERQQPSFPFVPGKPVTVLILTEPNQFKVAIDNQHYLEYRSRTPNLQAIQWVVVDGDASVQNIFIQ